MDLIAMIWVLLGLGIIGGCYLLYKYVGTPKNLNDQAEKSRDKQRKQQKKADWPIIEPTLEEVIKAVRLFSETLPKKVTRTILVKEDHSIDFEQLAPILQGIPSKPFYMAKETYDIFEEADKHLPPVLDKVQKAVDLYVKEKKQYPVIPYDPLRRVNYYLLLQGRYLHEEPNVVMYITKFDGLISHQKPVKKQPGH